MKSSLKTSTKYIGYLIAGIIAVGVLTLYFSLTGQPNKLKIAAGEPGSYYSLIAEKYKSDLAKDGIELQIIETKGAAENLALLNAGEVDIALSHGGVTTPKDSPHIASLGSISYQPLWVFTRVGAKTLTDLSQLRGLTIATGEKGSGVNVLANKLLNAEGVNDSNTKILHMSMLEAENLLMAGKIEAAIFMDPPEAGNIKGFFNSKLINEVSLHDAEALRRNFRFLHVTHIPPSGIDLASEQPHNDLYTVSPTAYVAVSKDMDPSIQYLLLSIIDKIHHHPTLINEENEFPADKDVDLHLSEDADVYYKKGRPFLQAYLPFQLASLIERLIKVLLPLILIVLPIFTYAPSIYNWHIRNKILKRYESLVEIEEELISNPLNKSGPEFETMLKEVEGKLNAENIPIGFSNEVFILREHIELVQRKINKHMENEKHRHDAG